MRTSDVLAAAAASVLLASTAYAGPDDDDDAERMLDGTREVHVGGAAGAGDVVGGATGFELARGFFTQSDVGGFFRLGGFTKGKQCVGPCTQVAVSDLQPHMGLSVGYDVVEWFSVSASFGTGFVADAAPYGNDDAHVPRDYGITNVNAGVTFTWFMPAPVDRLAIALHPFGGLTVMTPAATATAPSYGGNFGVGVGVRYASLLPNTSVGIDVDGDYVLMPTGNKTPQDGPAFLPMGESADANADAPGVVTFAILPVVKYVF